LEFELRCHFKRRSSILEQFQDVRIFKNIFEQKNMRVRLKSQLFRRKICSQYLFEEKLQYFPPRIGQNRQNSNTLRSDTYVSNLTLTSGLLPSMYVHRYIVVFLVTSSATCQVSSTYLHSTKNNFRQENRPNVLALLLTW
jgi:hypothetical protein